VDGQRFPTRLVLLFPDEDLAMVGFAKVEAAIKQDGLANPWNILMEDQTMGGADGRAKK
jgi:hypothetical protein